MILQSEPILYTSDAISCLTEAIIYATEAIFQGGRSHYFTNHFNNLAYLTGKDHMGRPASAATPLFYFMLKLSKVGGGNPPPSLTLPHKGGGDS